MHEIKVVFGDAIFLIINDASELKCIKEWKDTTHFHADFETHIVFDGNATVEIDGEDVVASSGDICLLAPSLSHYPKSYSADLEKTNFSFRLLRNYGYYPTEKRFSEYAYYDSIFKSVKSYTLFNEPKLIEIIKEIIALEKCEQNEHVIETLFATFFITISQGVKRANNFTTSVVFSESYENENDIKKRKIVEGFFQNRYSEQIGIQDLANELCLSIPQTHRIVKKIFNVGFKKILTKQRITHASILIKNGGIKINEIAVSCGYDSYNGFLSAFKSYTGKTPKEYEKSLK